jgi:hypothetical protein
MESARDWTSSPPWDAVGDSGWARGAWREREREGGVRRDGEEAQSVNYVDLSNLLHFMTMTSKRSLLYSLYMDSKVLGSWQYNTNAEQPIKSIYNNYLLALANQCVGERGGGTLVSDGILIHVTFM